MKIKNKKHPYESDQQLFTIIQDRYHQYDNTKLLSQILKKKY